MPRSIQSPLEDHDGRLRSLIAERNAFTDIHGRASTAMSESSDTPSVYSPSYFSPRPIENGESIAFPYSTPVSNAKDAGYSPQHDLDISEDPRISYTSEGYGRKSDTSDEDARDDDAETVARMSYLGPKMRFHSRAPWEEDALQEEDEDFPVNLPFPSKTTIKNMASAFSSPRPSFAGSISRPSEDSSISQSSTKRSFETVNSQLSLSHPRGGLYALAQESLSTNSLGQRSPKESLKCKLPSRLRSETANTPSLPRFQSPGTSPMNFRIPVEAPRTPPDRPFPSESVRYSSYESSEFAMAKGPVHPYANPDLVVSYAEEGSTDTPLDVALSSRDSKLTMRESILVDSVAKSSHSPLMSDFSMNSLGSKLRTPHINTKSISSPVSVIGSPQSLNGGSVERLPGVQNLSGWTERSTSAPFTLISLEEARAQRMRTSSDMGVATILSGDPATSFPGSSNDYAGVSLSPLSHGHGLSRTRGRSISAGAKTKSTLQNVVGQHKLESRDSEHAFREDVPPPPGVPPMKTLKNKKSGIMRLFNKEKDNRGVPPVPALPEGVHLSTVTQRTSTVQRIPVPSIISPDLTPARNGESAQTENLAASNTTSLSSRSIIPINTAPTATSPSPRGHGAVSAKSTPPKRPEPLTHAQSAPPNLVEFPVLKLRPVSSLFSASFGDLVPQESHRDIETTNSSRSLSPTILTSSLTTIPISNGGRRPAVPSSAAEQSDLKALQEEMLATKKAWNRQVWELERQVQALKAELEQLKVKNNGEYCDKCGRGRKSQIRAYPGVVNRPRAQTGSSSRFVNP